METMEKLLQELSDPAMLQQLLVTWGGRILGALAVLVIGRWIAKALVAWVNRGLTRAEVDPTISAFLGNIAYIALLAAVIIAALGTLGVNTTSFLAIVGAAGLAIGLALKDSLSNFAAGVMLVFFRPFRSGDFIDAAGVSGTVIAVRIFNTVLKTPDNKILTVPNALIYADPITNFSAEDTRRIDLVIGIGYDDDLRKAVELMETVVAQHDKVLADPKPAFLVLNLGDSSVEIAVRPWVQTADFWAVRSDLLRDIKATLDENGISIPYPQRDIHIVSQASQGDSA